MRLAVDSRDGVWSLCINQAKRGGSILVEPVRKKRHSVFGGDFQILFVVLSDSRLSGSWYLVTVHKDRHSRCLSPSPLIDDKGSRYGINLRGNSIHASKITSILEGTTLPVACVDYHRRILVKLIPMIGKLKSFEPTSLRGATWWTPPKNLAAMR